MQLIAAPRAHPPRDRSSPSLFTAVRSRGSREEDKEPGPATRPQPSPSPVVPAVVFGKLLGRSAPEGQWWGSRCRVCRRGGVEAAGSSPSQVLAGTSPSPPTRPPPPARQVSGRAAALFSFTSWRKMLCRTHITRPVHTREPLRAEQGAGPGRPRSTRVSARPAGTSRDSGNETSRPAELSPNFAERR
ncbi:unnamed protein product [Coccothraustes coccothraustes]